MEEEQSVWVSEEQRRICKELAEHYRAIISLLGDDPDREGLRKTPERTAKAMMQLTRGYRQSAQEIISSAVFEHTGSRIVVVRDIEFYSFCEHHLLPFFGKVHVGYIPSGGIVVKWLVWSKCLPGVFRCRSVLRHRFVKALPIRFLPRG